MKKTITSFILAILMASALAGLAQVPSTISYQGRVQVSGTNFTGNGLFKFALVSHGTNLNRQATALATVNSGFVTSISIVDGGYGYVTPPPVTITGATGSGATATAQISSGVVTSITVNNAGNGYTSPMVTIGPPTGPLVHGTYWSNDGSSVAGSQPASAVGIPVQGGLFTVLLGNAELANMTPIPPEVFRNPDVHLRVWFSDGVQGFAMVSPDHPMTSVGYAMIAAQFEGSVADSQLPANIARLDGTNQTFTGPVNFSSAFTGDGAGISNVNLAMIDSQGAITPANREFDLLAAVNVGVTPRSVAAADVNGDGHLDLISANNTSDNLSVLHNNGRGSMTLSLTLPAGDGPQIVIAADINGDGRADLISANGNTNTLSVWIGTGTGGFTPSATLTVGLYPFPVLATDVNGDGSLDLVSGNFGAATLSVLTNYNNGTFALASTPAVGNGPHGIAAADFNGDGSTDLASVANFVDSLYVSTNYGNGTFATATNIALGAGSYPLWVIAPDVNADGYPDLVTADFGLHRLSVLTNNGAGGFALASSPMVAMGSPYPHSIATADVNGDGRIDLICANQGSSSISIVTNGSNGRFVLAATAPVGVGASCVVAADLNGDGTSEFITANQGDNTLSIISQHIFEFRGRFDGTFTGSFSGNFNGNFNGTFTGNGGNLLGLNASSLSSGTVPDARLSANIARRAGGNDFTGNQTITSGRLGIGAAPAAQLHVAGTAQTVAIVDSTQTGGTWLGIENSSVGGQRWSIISSGSANGEGAGRLLFFTSQSNDTKMRLEPTGNLAIDGTLSQGSDRNRKENFTQISPEEILERVTALPITRWNYKDDPDVEHIGPMAQDFKASFGVGADDTSITTIDVDGVALAAIQGLSQKLKAKDTEISDLKQRLADLEKLVRSLSPSR